MKTTLTAAFSPQNLLIQWRMRNFAHEFVLHRSKRSLCDGELFKSYCLIQSNTTQTHEVNLYYWY